MKFRVSKYCSLSFSFFRNSVSSFARAYEVDPCYLKPLRVIGKLLEIKGGRHSESGFKTGILLKHDYDTNHWTYFRCPQKLLCRFLCTTLAVLGADRGNLETGAIAIAARAQPCPMGATNWQEEGNANQKIQKYRFSEMLFPTLKLQLVTIGKLRILFDATGTLCVRECRVSA